MPRMLFTDIAIRQVPAPLKGQVAIGTRRYLPSMRAHPLPWMMSCRISVSSSVVLPTPVFPMTYMWEKRSACLIGTARKGRRAFVRAKGIIRLSPGSIAQVSAAGRRAGRRVDVTGFVSFWTWFGHITSVLNRGKTKIDIKGSGRARHSGQGLGAQSYSISIN